MPENTSISSMKYYKVLKFEKVTLQGISMWENGPTISDMSKGTIFQNFILY